MSSSKGLRQGSNRKLKRKRKFTVVLRKVHVAFSLRASVSLGKA